MSNLGLSRSGSVPLTYSTPLQLSREIASVVAGLATGGGDRRGERIPLPCLLELEPMECSAIGSSEGMIVVGKDISGAGIGFFHPHRIPHQQVRLRLELSELGPLELVVEMLWCHFTRHGWYESGARILRIHAGGLGIARAG